jgi:hypothetical protein
VVTNVATASPGGVIALDAAPLDVAGLPAVLAGPILRRLTRTTVAVWVALSTGDDVTLTVHPSNDAAQTATATTKPIQVGSHLWLTTIIVQAPGGQFASGTAYSYTLSSPGWAAEPDWPSLSYDGTGPGFLGLPTVLDDFTLLHTSCRKAHGGGMDALATTSDLVAERLAAAEPHARPHLLMLTGDQIYADEVPAPLAPRIRRIAADLVGIDETQPFGPLPAIGGRQGPTNAFGFTSEAATDHLWTLGEYLATYLLYWSDVLWPPAIPRWTDVDAAQDLDPAAGLDQPTWDDLADAVTRFGGTAHKVRRLLANVPTMMILDDHEITDDWNLDHPWTETVYANAEASRVVTNGMLAYLLCQHWGNAPDRFAVAGSTEAQLLAAAHFTGASPDTPALRALLGVPTAAPAAPPVALRDLSAPGAIRYDYTLDAADGYPFRLVALDERTVREFLRVDHPAGRVSLAALALMLPTPPPAAAPVTVVVTPSPAFGTHIIEHVIQPASSLLPGGAAFSDYESWSGSTPNHQDLIARLAAYQPVVVLSGDVHYGFTGSVTDHRGGSTSRIAQLTASATQNAETKTVMMHLIGDMATKVGIERSRTYTGFSALTAAQRALLVSPPVAGAVLPYDDLADLALGRVFRAGQETPAVLSSDIAAAYGFGTGDWSYEIDPVDDEEMPAPGALLTAMTGAPAPWTGWDADKSHAMMGALRAGDLHRIGRVWTGLPQVAWVAFSSGPPLVVQQRLTGPVGVDPAVVVRHHTDTSVTLS